MAAACIASAADVEPLLQVAGGGTLTIEGIGRDQLLVVPEGLTHEQRVARRRGEAFFNTPFVAAPSPATLRDGVGPLFNSPSCEVCHNNLGRGRPPPDDGQQSLSLVVQLSWQDPDGRWGPHPVYGPNLNPLAVAGVPVEGRLVVEYETIAGRFADGTAWTIRRPHYSVVDPGYGPLGPGTAFSPRLAQPLIGGGLLEAVPDEAILAMADAEDRNSDGISGRPNWIVDGTGHARLGRFGWKANQPDLRAQTVAAFSAEQGITSPDLPHTGCTAAQQACLLQPDGGSPEIGEDDLQTLVLFMRTVPVPARSGLESPGVRRGAVLFRQSGCADCHVPTLVTARQAALPLLAGQRIHAYTDLLLHDLGPGLADGRLDHLASGSEWRTAPLWGIGRAAEIGTDVGYLHDGRARTLVEAILWHGGEAERSRQAFIATSAADRESLLTFLGSL